MADEQDTGRNDRLTAQMKRLAHGLRDEGVSPRRELWDDIDRAISEAEGHQIRPAQRRRWGWPQVAAIAALVTFMLLAGRWGREYGSRDTGSLPEVGLEIGSDLAAGAPEASAREVIEQALSELNLALAEDPDNLSLSNLALMLHQARGRMLRLNPVRRFSGG